MYKNKRTKRGPGRPKKGEIQPLEKELCYRIKEVRMKHGYTQKDICEKVLVEVKKDSTMNENSYRRYENGRLRVPEWMVEAFIKCFPEDKDYIIGYKEQDIENANEDRKIQNELRAELENGYEGFCFNRYLDSLGYKIIKIDEDLKVTFYNKEKVFKLRIEQYRKLVNEVENIIEKSFKDNTSQKD